MGKVWIDEDKAIDLIKDVERFSRRLKSYSVYYEGVAQDLREVINNGSWGSPANTLQKHLDKKKRK